MTFEKFAAKAEIINRSDYYNNMKAFYDSFPRRHIEVFFYDELRDEPEEFVRRLYSFIDVDEMFKPQSLFSRINTARRPRSIALARLAYVTGRKLRELGRPNIVGGIKRLSLFEKLLYRPYRDSKPEVPPGSVRKLGPLYHKDYDRLEDLIGKPVPSAWADA